MNDQEQKHCDRLTARIAVLEAQLAEREKATGKALEAAQRAVDKAEEIVTTRLDGFPQLYLTRQEGDALLETLRTRVGLLEAERADFVTSEKYEDKLNSEATARTAALLRVDEKFEDYVKRYEARQREVDQALTIQKASADTAQRFAEGAAFKANRNIALIGVGLAALVIVMNMLGFA